MTILFIQDTLIGSHVYNVGDVCSFTAAQETTQINAFAAVAYPAVNQSGSQPPRITLPFTGLTAAGIQAAINALGVAGGGTVQLPTGKILLSTSLVPVAGVYLVGVMPLLSTTLGLPDDATVTIIAGTILAPTGAFPAVTWNTTVLGVPGSQAAFSALGINNIGFKNIGFVGGTYGIFGGATNNASCFYSEFVNLYFNGQTQWGMNLINYQHCKFERVWTYNCQNGQFHGIDLPGSILQPGNSTYKDLYCVIPSSSATNMLCRGITFITNNGGGASGQNNMFSFDMVLCNRFGQATTTQAATMAAVIATTITNTSASIVAANTFAAGDAVGFSATTGTPGGQVVLGTTYYVSATGLSGAAFQVSATVGGAVITFNASGTPNVLTAKFTITDGTKWAVGMPVTPSATQNGLTLSTIYFVTSLSGTAMTVSKTYGGAPIPMTAASAVNLINQGFPGFEMIGLPGAGTMTNCIIEELDVGGGGTCAMFFQNCTGFEVHVTQVPSTSQSTQSLCGRGMVNGQIFSPQICSTDLDNSSNSSAMQFYGSRSTGASVGYMGAGIAYDPISTNTVLSLGSQFDTAAAGALTLIPSQSNLIVPKGLGIGQYTTSSGSANPTLTNGCMVYSNTVSGTTITLPNVTANTLGWFIDMLNTTATPQTITTVGGTQLFNGIAGRTSITLNTGASVRLTSQNMTGATFGYAISGSSTAMSGGVIAAPT